MHDRIDDSVNYDEDEVVADGMCDDEDDGPPEPQAPTPLGSRRSSLWSEAISTIHASRRPPSLAK
jgi:hypothetical protein